MTKNILIVDAKISKDTNPFGPLPDVTVTFSSGETRKLFSFDPEEVSFYSDELVGLTESEVGYLLFEKEMSNLKRTNLELEKIII